MSFMQSAGIKRLQDAFARGDITADEFRAQARILRKEWESKQTVSSDDAFMQSGAVKRLQDAFARGAITADGFRASAKRLRKVWDRLHKTQKRSDAVARTYNPNRWETRPSFFLRSGVSGVRSSRQMCSLRSRGSLALFGLTPHRYSGRFRLGPWGQLSSLAPRQRT